MIHLASIHQCSNFIESLQNAVNGQKYLVAATNLQGKPEFTVSHISTPTLRMAQIMEYVSKCSAHLSAVSNCFLPESVHLLTKLDVSLDRISGKILHSIKQCWWYRIASFFGYTERCPENFIAIRNCVKRTLLEMRNKEAQFTQTQQRFERTLAATEAPDQNLKEETAELIIKANAFIKEISERNRLIDGSIHRRSVFLQQFRQVDECNNELQGSTDPLYQNYSVSFLKRDTASIETSLYGNPAEIHFSQGINKISDAEIILFGEIHIDENHVAMECRIINQLFRPGDLVLLEGLSSDQYLEPEDPQLEKTGLKFAPYVAVKGWEDAEAHREQGEIMARLLEAIQGNKLPEDLLGVDRVRDNDLTLQRSHHMIDTIKSEKSRVKRIFVIAGRKHLLDSSKNSKYKFNALKDLKGHKCAMILMDDSRLYSEEEVKKFADETT